MQIAAQGSLGDNLKLDWMRTPHTKVAVPVTAAAANRARSSAGARFHIDRSQSISVTQLLLSKNRRYTQNPPAGVLSRMAFAANLNL